MGYEAAIKKAWDGLKGCSDKDRFSLKFLSDTYDISLKEKKCVSVSSGTPTKDHLTILLLHYLIGTIKNGFSPSREWVSFKDIEGGSFYYPAFREGVVEPILKKFGQDPEKLSSALERFKAGRIDEGDFAVEIAAFADVSIRVILWKGDEEFGPEATILFDKNLTKIYSTEDIAVFLRTVAHSL